MIRNTASASGFTPHSAKRCPPPDLIIRLTAPLEVLITRRRVRTRELDIVTAEDLTTIDAILDTWMSANIIPTIPFDTSAHDPDYSLTTATLLTALDKFLSSP